MLNAIIAYALSAILLFLIFVAHDEGGVLPAGSLVLIGLINALLAEHFGDLTLFIILFSALYAYESFTRQMWQLEFSARTVKNKFSLKE